MVPFEQKAQKAFGLRNSRDMLKKLRWELDNLFCRQRHDVEACQYHAFNCAVTAWHVTDWLWQDIPPELKHKRKWESCEDFQRYVRNECLTLKLCYEVGRGSKHCLVERKPDPTISADISTGEGYDYGNPIIMEDDKQHDAGRVFGDAQQWFENFLRTENILSEGPFLPSGDNSLANADWLRQVRNPG